MSDLKHELRHEKEIEPGRVSKQVSRKKVTVYEAAAEVVKKAKEDFESTAMRQEEDYIRGVHQGLDAAFESVRGGGLCADVQLERLLAFEFDVGPIVIPYDEGFLVGIELGRYLIGSMLRSALAEQLDRAA